MHAAPTLVENAGLPLTPYYQYLLALKQVAPVVTAANDYMDADGVTHTYGENAELDAGCMGTSIWSITTSVPKQPVSRICSRWKSKGNTA